MKTMLISEVVNMSGILPLSNLHDHSIIMGSFSTSYFELEKNSQEQHRSFHENNDNTHKFQQPRKNFKKMNDSFFMIEQVSKQVLETIEKLESLANNQSQLDSLWNQVKD